MTKVTNLLISPDIVEFMEARGFHASETTDSKGDATLWFQYHEPYQKHVIFKNGGRITCRCWNDEENAERFCTTLDVFKSNPSLHDWQLLMHVAGIVFIPELETHLTIQNLMV